MRIVFAGTPEFARQALASLLAAGHEIALVLTQPDRPAGRGLTPSPSPVKRHATEAGLPVFQPPSLRDAADQARVSRPSPDVIVVAAYGLILPEALLDAPKFGAINIHASLLPRWRGAAPIQRALLAGDSETGISIMQMEPGLDTGPVLMQIATPITSDDDAGTLHNRLAGLGATMIVAALRQIEGGCVRAVAQPSNGVTYASKITKQETVLDWSRPARDLERAVRAFRPAPGATAPLAGETLKVWASHVVPVSLPIGSWKAEGDALIVGCGQDALAITELQKAGGRRMRAADFLRGRALHPGTGGG